MPSNLSAFPYIQERSEATPGLWNYPFSVLSANIASLNSTLDLGHFQQLSIGSTPPSYLTTAAVTIEVNSNQSDYLYLVDSAAQRSSYIIGSRAGGTADGLNIWDASAGTMVASFSKQSSRFYSPVVGVTFDVGGSDFNVRAFSAVGDGVADDTGSFIAAIAALPTSGGVVSMPSGNYKVTDTLNLSFASTGKNSIVLRGAGVGATKITSTVTNRPAIISNDTFSQANILEGFDLYQSGNVLPSFRSGNFGIRNVGQDCPYLSLRNLRVRFFGDTGIRIEGGQGPFSIQDVEVQSCASYGIHLDKAADSGRPVEVQIIGGNIHTCVGGLRLTGATSTGVYDIDIELGTVALYPAVVLDGACSGGVFVDPSLSVQAVVSPAAVVSISNALGVKFVSGQYTTASANVDGVLLDSTAARLNAFEGGYYAITGGGYPWQCVNGAKQNTFSSPQIFNPAAGKGILKNSTDTGDLVIFVGSSAVSDDRSIVIGGGNLAVGSGTALLPSLNFGGTSEVSLGLYRSAASTIAQSYGTLILSGLDTSAGNLSSGSITNAASITMTRTGTGAIFFNMTSGNQAYILANNTTLDTRVASTQARWLNNAGTVAIMTLSNGGQLSVSSDVVSSNGTIRGVALWGTSGLSVGGTLIPQISSMSSLVGAFVVQPSASSFTGITWAAAGIGDIVLCAPFQSTAASSISSGLVPHSLVTVAGQIEFRLSNVSTLVQNQSAQTWVFTRIRPF